MKIPVHSFRSQLIFKSHVLPSPSFQLYILIIISFVFELFFLWKLLFIIFSLRGNLKGVISKEIIFSLSLVFENFTMMGIGGGIFSFIVLGTWGPFHYENSWLKVLSTFLVLFLWKFSLLLFLCFLSLKPPLVWSHLPTDPNLVLIFLISQLLYLSVGLFLWEIPLSSETFSSNLSIECFIAVILTF